MTDEEEEKVREFIRMEVQARLLRAPIEIDHKGYDTQSAFAFCDDMRWHYPRAYQRITKEVLEEFNVDINRINKLKDEANKEDV